MSFLGIYIILKLSFGVSTRGFLDFLLGGIGDGWADEEIEDEAESGEVSCNKHRSLISTACNDPLIS